ncbi:MAG: alpha/beta fold hydrolase [Verrucomicrobiota bacterium]
MPNQNSSPTLRRRLANFALRTTAVLTLLTLILVAWITHRASSYIIVPERRPTTAWHQDFLRKPAQHSLAIHPFSATSPDGVTLEALFIQAAHKPGDGERYQRIRRLLTKENPALVPFLPHTSAHGTVLWLHGRNSIKENALPIAERFVAAGYNFICFDARAHGQSTGKYITYGPREADDVTTVLDAAEEQFARFHLKPFAAFGNSLGGAVILQSLAREPRLRAGVSVSAFADLNQLIKEHAHRKLPVPTASLGHLVLKYAAWRANFNPFFASPATHAQTIDVPVMIVHGQKDHLIPPHHSEQIYNAIPHSNKTHRIIPDANHRSVLSTGGDPLYADIIQFIHAALTKPSSSQPVAATY